MYQIVIRSAATSNIVLKIGTQSFNLASTTSWQRLIQKFTIENNNTNYIDLIFSPGEYWFYNAKLETGIIATAWTPAPEDFDIKLYSLQSEFNQRADSIEMSISKKQDIGVTAVRYIRDWLDGNNVDNKNYWGEINVITHDGENVLDSSLIRLQNETGFSVSMSDPNKWTLVYAKNWTVGHNSDGSKQINIRVWGNGNFSIGSYDTNKTVTLDKIPRYTSIKTWSVAEVGKTYAKINWGTADTVDWVRVYLNDSSQWTDNPGSVNGTSGSFVYTGAASSGASIPSVSTLKPGTTYKLKCWVKRKDSQLSTTSSNIEFTTKSVASISNLNEGFSYNIGDDLNLTFENSSENKSWLAFYIKDESDNWEEILKTDEVIQANSYTWQLSNYASIFYSKLPNDNSKKCKIECGTTITENKQTISCISSKIVGIIKVKNSNPVFTDFDYGDEDTSTQAVLGNKTYMIKNYGSMKVRIPVAKKAVAKNGATIIKYIISVDGVAIDSYEKKYSDSSEILCELGKYNTNGIGTISIYAIDSTVGFTSVSIYSSIYSPKVFFLSTLISFPLSYSFSQASLAIIDNRLASFSVLAVRLNLFGFAVFGLRYFAWVIHSQEPFFNCLVLPSLLSFLSIFIPPISPYHFLKI